MSIPDGIPKGWRMYQLGGVNKRIEDYPHHFTCFDCRKMFKKTIKYEFVLQYSSYPEFFDKYRPICPDCGRNMLNMGRGFRPPKRNDLKKWRILERQARAGGGGSWLYHPGCNQSSTILSNSRASIAQAITRKISSEKTRNYEYPRPRLLRESPG